MVGTLVRGSRYAARQFDLHLTLGLAIVTSTLQVLTGQPFLAAFVAIFNGYIFVFFKKKTIPLVCLSVVGGVRGRGMFRGMNRGPERPFQPHEGPAPEYMAAIEAANRKEMEEV